MSCCCNDQCQNSSTWSYVIRFPFMTGWKMGCRCKYGKVEIQSMHIRILVVSDQSPEEDNQQNPIQITLLMKALTSLTGGSLHH